MVLTICILCTINNGNIDNSRGTMVLLSTTLLII
nr:MAG TPA: hypothetical protein [Caudoviricetes sp.]